MKATRPFLILGQFRIANFPHNEIVPPQISCRVVFGDTVIMETNRYSFPSDRTKARIPMEQQTKYMLGSHYQDENLRFELVHEYEADRTRVVGRYDLPICLIYPHNESLGIKMTLYDTIGGCENITMTCWCAISTRSSCTSVVENNAIEKVFQEKTAILQASECRANDAHTRRQITTDLLQRIPKEYLKLFQDPAILAGYVSNYRNRQYEEQTDASAAQFAAGTDAVKSRKEYEENPYFKHYDL